MTVPDVRPRMNKRSEPVRRKTPRRSIRWKRVYLESILGVSDLGTVATREKKGDGKGQIRMD